MQADGIIYIATQDADNLQELYYSNISGSGGSIAATAPVKISAPQAMGGGVMLAIPNFGNADEVIYSANQDDANKTELYIVDLNTPGTSTKINATLTADQAIQAGVGCADGTKVFYLLETISTGTVDLYVVTISNPGVATKLNPNLAAGREVGTFVTTPDCSKVVYTAQINTTAEELFVTELSNPGVATKADGAPTGTDHVINQLSLSVDGTKAFWVGGSSQIGQSQNLLTVSLSNLGNETQVNGMLPPGGRVSDYDVSPNANSVVYRVKVSMFVASDLFFVDLSSGSPSMPAQVNPVWAVGSPFLFGLESVRLVDNGTVALYDGPRDVATEGELYETPLSALQTSTELNAALGTPTSGLRGIAQFMPSFDDSLVAYSDGIGGTSSIHVVDRSNPGSTVKPFVPGPSQWLGLNATFNPDSDLVASLIINLDAQDNPESQELHVADPAFANTNIRVNTDLAAGLGVFGSFWLLNGAPVVPDGDPDGDGDPNSTDPDDDNDGIGDVFDTDPLVANNFCSGGDPQNVTFQQVVTGNLSCAAEVSISVVPTTTVQASGDLRLIAPTVTFQDGFSVAGALTVISSHPCPACSP